MSDELRVSIRSDLDIVTARQRGRELATQLGFAGSDLTIIVTAISEVVRNIVVYAQVGELILAPAENDLQQGILIVARDEGPGIPDVGLAMQDGYSTGGSLGLGLPGAKRLMDDFEIDSVPGRGTIITMRKWKR